MKKERHKHMYFTMRTDEGAILMNFKAAVYICRKWISREAQVADARRPSTVKKIKRLY